MEKKQAKKEDGNALRSWFAERTKFDENPRNKHYQTDHVFAFTYDEHVDVVL